MSANREYFNEEGEYFIPEIRGGNVPRTDKRNHDHWEPSRILVYKETTLAGLFKDIGLAYWDCLWGRGKFERKTIRQWVSEKFPRPTAKITDFNLFVRRSKNPNF